MAEHGEQEKARGRGPCLVIVARLLRRCLHCTLAGASLLTVRRCASGARPLDERYGPTVFWARAIRWRNGQMQMSHGESRLARLHKKEKSDKTMNVITICHYYSIVCMKGKRLHRQQQALRCAWRLWTCGGTSAALPLALLPPPLVSLHSQPQHSRLATVLESAATEGFVGGEQHSRERDFFRWRAGAISTPRLTPGVVLGHGRTVHIGVNCICIAVLYFIKQYSIAWASTTLQKCASSSARVHPSK